RIEAGVESILRPFAQRFTGAPARPLRPPLTHGRLRLLAAATDDYAQECCQPDAIRKFHAESPKVGRSTCAFAQVPLVGASRRPHEFPVCYHFRSPSSLSFLPFRARRPESAAKLDRRRE